MAEIVAEMAAAAVANPLNDSDNEAVKADHSSDEKVAMPEQFFCKHLPVTS